MLYHVTDKDSAIEVWNSDRFKPSINSKKRPKRKKMREDIDKVGNDTYDNWVDRDRALFAWSSFDKSTRYAERFLEPAIIEFDIDGLAWYVKNHIAEDLYKCYRNSNKNCSVDYLVSQSEVWNGLRDSEIEVWLRPPSVGNIYSVYDSFGDPINIPD